MSHKYLLKMPKIRCHIFFKSRSELVHDSSRSRDILFFLIETNRFTVIPYGPLLPQSVMPFRNTAIPTRSRLETQCHRLRAKHFLPHTELNFQICRCISLFMTGNAHSQFSFRDMLKCFIRLDDCVSSSMNAPGFEMCFPFPPLGRLVRQKWFPIES